MEEFFSTPQDVAKILNLRYLGISKSFPNLWWFEDKKTKSSFVAKDFEDARDKQQKMWERFGVK
jgi:hypothetical protein